MNTEDQSWQKEYLANGIDCKSAMAQIEFIEQLLQQVLQKLLAKQITNTGYTYWVKVEDIQAVFQSFVSRV